jgi:hypothetical protein
MKYISAVYKDFIRRIKDQRGFLQSLIPLIPTAISLLGGKKSSGSSSGSVSTQPNMPDWQYSLGQDLSGWASKFLGMYSPGEAYGGQLTAKTPTSLESSGLAELQKLLGSPATGDLYGAAKNQVMDTLSGKYADPNTSPFIQAYSKLAGQNLNDSINQARGQRGARGTYFTRAGIQEESQLTERTQNYLNALIGDFMNSERGRQMTAVDQARNLEGFAQNSSLQRITASQTLGSLERVLEQSDLEAKYDAWLRQRSELQQVPGAAQSLFGTNVPTVTTTTQPKQATSGNDIAPWISLAMRFFDNFSQPREAVYA